MSGHKFPGHPLFDTPKMLSDQVERPDDYPSLQSFLSALPPAPVMTGTPAPCSSCATLQTPAPIRSSAAKCNGF